MTTPVPDSSTGGYLAPVTLAPTDDAGFDQLLQPVLVGITGLDPTLVRRAWQANVDPTTGLPVTPPDPTRNTDWCSFRTIDEDADVNPTFIHDGSDNGGLGTSTSLRTEEAQVMVSFYGPNATANASLLRDGFGISQNREAMRASGVAFVRTERITKVPDLQNGAWIRRADLVFRCRRVAVRTYAIRNVESLSGQIITDQGVTANL